MRYKGVYFDFGFILAFPNRNIDPIYYYLNWNNIPAAYAMLKSHDIRRWATEADFIAALNETIINPYKHHEETNGINPDIIGDMFRLFGLNQDDAKHQQIVSAFFQKINTLTNFHLDEEAKETVRILRDKGYITSIISNMMLPGFLMHDMLKNGRIHEYFSTISISSEAGYIKPHPEIFKRTLRNDKLQANEVIFIGDTYRQDIIGAHRCGIDSVWHNNRNEPEPEGVKFNKFSISKISDIIAFLLP
jgi:FMN phosphatase YigB (HAD superfamily)